MSQSEPFLHFLDEIRPRVDATLDRLVPAADVVPGRLHEAMRYSLLGGGKRIRPALVVLAGDVLGVDREHALVGGGALEMIHTYSLIHDDLPALDNDDLRRGRETSHRRFDEATAILAGDALLTLGLTTLAARPADIDPESRRRAVEMVGARIGTLGMIGGQVEDLEAEKEWPADPEATLERIHRRKTGELIVACLHLAGLYAAAPPSTLAQLLDLGERLGLLFQIGDDILDVEGTSGTLGKTAGKDAAADKLTYPGLFGLGRAKRLLERTRDEALDVCDALPERGGLFPSLIRYLSTRQH
ncbi:MAG: polyprenyl synthetase family protein [Acidobacteriota bacterium]